MWWASVKEKRETGFGAQQTPRDDDPEQVGGNWDQGPGTADNDLARALKDG